MIKRYAKRSSSCRLAAMSVALVLIQVAAAAGHSLLAQQRAEVTGAASDVRRLEVGKPMERELRGGEFHTYEIAIEANRFLHAVVEQRGIDVVVLVSSPDGRPLMEVDSPNGTQGDEPVMFITETAGECQLTVKSLKKDAPVGHYVIRVQELRAPTDQDRALIEKGRVLQEALKFTQEVERLYEAGNYDAALPLADRVLAIRKQFLGAEHRGTAEALNNLAELYKGKGNYTKAESFHLEALAIREKALGADHPDTAISYNNLAALYYLKGDYAKAEPLFLRDLAINEKVFGPVHPTTAVSLNNLAELYTAKGDYAKAEPLHWRALQIRNDKLGPLHPLTADSLNNFAGLYSNLGNYETAERMYTLALKIYEHAFGAEHRSIAAALSNLAFLYFSKGAYAAAEPLYLRALEIDEKIIGPDHAETAELIDNLAALYYAQGNLAKAEPYHLRAAAIREKALGTAHPSTANSFYNLAVLFESKGNHAKAVDFQSRCNEVSERDLVRNLAPGSERQKFLYLNRTKLYTDFMISLHVRSAPNDIKAKRAALTVLLQRKGRTLDAMTDALTALRGRLSPEDQTLLNHLQEIRSQLSVLTLRGPGQEGQEKHEADLLALAEREDNLQNDISRRSAEFRAQSRSQPQQVTIEEVQNALPQGAALVEIAQYHPFDARERRVVHQYGSPRYVAYVLPSQGEPLWVELGDAAAIDRKIDAFRQALRDKHRQDVRQLARAVDQNILQPVRNLLGQTQRIFIAPDSALNLIPFAALVDERGDYLVKNYHFTYLTSGRDLLRLKEKIESKAAPLVMADADFDNAAPGNPVSENQPAATGPNRAKPTPETLPAVAGQQGPVLGDVEFEPLKRLRASVGEAAAVKRTLGRATVLLRRNATESALKQRVGPSILHIATHGFFLDEEAKPGDRGSKSTRIVVRKKQKDSPQVAGVRNPAMRSGLFFAGANRSKSGDDDGVLTAFEAAGLDLWGTKLVVLSACDTGVGDVLNGEGVQGLRRALVLAGSESQMMSLWPVSDQGTRELMVAYYKRLKSSQGRSLALRQTQLKMLASGKRKHPYYWASFIQSGEWANLDGKR